MNELEISINFFSGTFMFLSIYTLFTHIFFRKAVNQTLKVRILFLARNKTSFLTLMTSRILLVIWIVLIWTGSMKTNHFNQKRKTSDPLHSLTHFHGLCGACMTFHFCPLKVGERFSRLLDGS